MKVLEYSIQNCRDRYVVTIDCQHPIITCTDKNIEIGVFNNIIFNSQAQPDIYYKYCEPHSCEICLIGRNGNQYNSFQIRKDDLCDHGITIEDIQKGFDDLNNCYKSKFIENLSQLKNKINCRLNL